MPLNPQIFREYDIRGVADRDFNETDLRQLAHAVIAYFQSHGRTAMVVAHDCRLSSPRLVSTICNVARQCNMHVVNLGQVTTPAFYFATKHLNIDAGIMVTASHNPPPDNGMKINLGPATIHGQEIQRIRLIAETLKLEEVAATADAAANLNLYEDYDIATPYISTLLDKINLGPRKLKVVVDCGNGTSGPLTQRFLQSLGVDYTPLYFEPDGSFPNHEADPTKAKNLQELRARVLLENADLGIGFDGDGDRIGVVDDKGSIIWGDILMALFWREILPKYPNTTCLVEVKCSQALVDEINRLGGKPEFCKTGHSLIKARMRETGAVFTGEMSGHIFFADEYYGFDDALYACGRLLRLLSNTNHALSELVSQVPKYYSTAEVRIPCSDDIKFSVVDKLRKDLSKNYELITVDGVRVLFAHGWGLFRCSNTGPIIVARCEARSEDLLKEYMAVMEQAYAKVCSRESIPWEL